MVVTRQTKCLIGIVFAISSVSQVRADQVFQSTASPGEMGAAVQKPSVAGIETSIRRYGAKATIRALETANQWASVTDRISSGASAWIALAPKLASGADAGFSEDLGISLAYSLTKNPYAVLQAIDPTNGPALGVDRVCGIPFVEDTVGDVEAYRRQALGAVARVPSVKLESVKTACLASLRGAQFGSLK